MGYSSGFWVGQDRPLQKIIHHSLFTIHYSLNVYVGCRRDISDPCYEEITRKNDSLFIINNSLFIKKISNVVN